MTDSLQRKLAREQAARHEAERLLEEKADELYESLQQVRSSEDLLQSALSNMADGLLLTSKDNQVVLANERLGAIYPELLHLFRKGTDLGDQFSQLLDHPSYRSFLEQDQDEAFLEITLESGRRVSVVARKTSDGLIASTHRDVTLQKQAEEERRGLLVDLLKAQRMEAIGRLSGMIAHDFNNIIASIKGYAGFLQEDMPDDENLRNSLDRILMGADRAEALIQQILEYGGHEKGETPRVSLVPVLEDCVELITARLADGCRLNFEPPEEPIWVEADEIHLQRLFMNLLTNANQAMTARPGHISMFVDQFESLDLESKPFVHENFAESEPCSTHAGNMLFGEPCVCLTLIDTGIGISADVMPRIFEMYFSTSGTSAHRGIGMTSVADILSRYGGGIRLASQKDKGTVVEVVLPVITRSTTMQVKILKQKIEKSTRATDVLIIDDDENVGEMIRETLERAGIRAEFYSSPEDALALLMQDPGRCKMVLSDQIMPGMKGSEVYEALREAGIGIPFIVCSAHLDADSDEMIASLQGDFLTKPVDRDELLSKVRKYL